MSLESSIDLLTKAINDLIAVHGVKIPERTGELGVFNPLKIIETEPKKEKETKKSEPTTPKSSEASAPTTAESLPEPTYDDVKKIILAISGKSRNKVIALLARYGAAKGPDLKPEQYALFVVEGNAVLAGELDPEAGA